MLLPPWYWIPYGAGYIYSHTGHQMPFALSLALHPPQHKVFIWYISITLFKDRKNKKTALQPKLSGLCL